MSVNIALVIPQVELPKIPPSFTKQYPSKGGNEEINETVKNLKKE